jgi:hypothetical protein
VAIGLKSPLQFHPIRSANSETLMRIGDGADFLKKRKLFLNRQTIFAAIIIETRPSTHSMKKYGTPSAVTDPP